MSRNADKIEWIQPQEITQTYIRQTAIPALHRMSRLCTRYFLMAVIPIEVLCYFVSPRAELIAAPVGLAVLIYQIPLNMWVNIRQSQKAGIKHCVDSRGVRFNVRRFLWPRIAGFTISDNPISADIGNLNVNPRAYGWMSLAFSRREVSDQEIGALI